VNKFQVNIWEEHKKFVKKLLKEEKKK